MVFNEFYDIYMTAFKRNKYDSAFLRAEEHAETLREQGEEVYFDALLDAELSNTKWQLADYEDVDIDLYGFTRLWLAIAANMSREIHASGVKKMVTVYKG